MRNQLLKPFRSTDFRNFKLLIAGVTKIMKDFEIDNDFGTKNSKFFVMDFN